MDEARPESRLKADLTLGAFLLAFACVAIIVLKQSDAELILPGANLDLAALLDRLKDGTPGGSFIVPLLPFEMPLELFYSFGPLLLLGLHAIVLLGTGLLRAATPVLRLAALWLPFCLLGVIRWHFAPYVSARPAPPLAGSLIETFQVLALAGDLALIAIVLLPRPSSAGDPRRANPAARLLRVAGAAATIWLIVLLAWGPARSILGTGGLGAVEGMALAVAVILAAGLFVGTASRRRSSSSRFLKETLTMRDRLVLLIAFLMGALAPAYGRAIDLSGARLVAGEASSATGGIDLSNWRLRRANFDHATMARIRMVGTDLRNATLDYADLSSADLTRSRLASASLRHADLSGATLTDVHFAGASLRNADLRGAVLAGPDGRSGDIVLAQQDTATDAQPAKPPARTDTKDRLDMTGADLTGAHLDGANLSNAILKDAILKDADLRGALFCGADLRNVDLTGAKNIGSAIFNGADLAGATLPADMAGGHIRNANLFRARIENAATHSWAGLIGSGIRDIDSLTGSPPHDAAIAVAIRTVTEQDAGTRTEPCSEPAATATPAKP